jgi:glycosyltransferase involved in cell wall biosynthesis
MTRLEKILFVTSNGGVHDFQFLNKMVNDYEVLMLHYGARKILPEIRGLEHPPDPLQRGKLRIISKRPIVHSFPLLSELRHFKGVVKDFKPDIVHSGYVWQVGILASHIDFHPHLSMPWASDILLDTHKNFITRKLVRRVMRQSDAILSDSEVVKRKIMNDYGVPDEKITVFPRGIDTGLFKPLDKNQCRDELGLDRSRFVVLFNRHLAPVYGIKYLLEGFKRFVQGKEDVMLLLYSGGPLYKDTLRFIERNGLGEKIRFFGRQTNSKIPVYLNAADVYISTSLSDGTPLSLLEAMACGSRILVTRLPGVVDWINADNGVLIEPRNPESVKDGLERCYNGSVPDASQINRKIICDRADWDKNYLKLKEVYDNLVDS